MEKRINLNQSDFKILVGGGFYYLDKSLFIQEVWEEGKSVLLIPRPRRFGKTTNLSMLRYFFENLEGEENAKLFKELKIASKPEIMENQGKYPVIYLTLREAKEDSFEEFLKNFSRLLAKEFRRHEAILEGKVLRKEEEKNYYDILNKKASIPEIKSSLFELTEFLHRLYGKKVIVLIDEYDTPVHNAYRDGYFDKIISFIGGFLGSVLKDNPYLEKGVVTGILRVAKESIFSEFNNSSVFNLFSKKFRDQFGFSEEEVKNLLKERGLESYAEKVQEHYNGYLIGKKVIYNPWSILSWASDPEHEFIFYWTGTSSNNLVRDLIIQEDSSFMEEDLERLLLGKSIRCEILEDIVLRDMKGKRNVIWSLFLFSGYLKPLNMFVEEDKTCAELKIPNLEVKSFFKRTVREWLDSKRGGASENLQEMLNLLTKGEIKEFGVLFQEWMVSLLSYHDTSDSASREKDEVAAPEKVYHAFLLGLLASLKEDYRIDSNAESGYGRFDLMLIPRNKKSTEMGIIIELKTRKREDPEKEIEEALQQIVNKDYPAKLRDEGTAKILGVSLLFQGKFVWGKSLGLSDFPYVPQSFKPTLPTPPIQKKTILKVGKDKNFDFTKEFDDLLEHFEEFQKVALSLAPTLEKKLDLIEEKLHDICPPIKDKSEIPKNVWSRLKQILKAPELQNQPSIQKERETLKTSYEKIARWLGLLP